MFLELLTEDLRANAEGVFAAYTDIVYDSDLISVIGPIAFSPQFQNQAEGDASTAGVVDEAGGIGGQNPIGAG